jgi:nucleotide-binding universal stress UspA family protein
VHALKLALVAHAEFSIMHVDHAVTRDDFEDFPKVRPLLAQWGVLAGDAPKQAVAELGVAVRKIRAFSDNPVQAITDRLALHPTELIVLSTHQYDGISRWTHQLVAESVALAGRAKTLFVPTHVEGFIAKESGMVRLRNILVPLAAVPSPQPAIDAAVALASMLDCEQVAFHFVHAGDITDCPRPEIPKRPGWTSNNLVGSGQPVDWILASGAEFDVDLIVMTTQGHNSLSDSLRGSVTERVLHGARCPVLSIPA